MDFRSSPLKKVLIINIFGIGDVLFTTPIVSNLKKQFPELKIGYLCNRRGLSVLQSHPHIERIFIYERDEFKDIYERSRAAYLQKIFSLWNDIKREKYDAVFDVSLSSFTPFFSWWIGIPHRIGFNYKNRGFLLNDQWPLSGYEDRHVVDHYLELLNSCGVEVPLKNLEFYIKEEDGRFAEKFLKENRMRMEIPTIGLVPGGGLSWGKDARFKLWSVQNYAKLADKMIEKTSCQIILFGDQKDQPLIDEFLALVHHPMVNAAGKTTLGQFAALTRACRLLVANDGGPLHVAVASGVKTVSIFGPVDSKVYGPYPSFGHEVVKKDLACRPCYRNFRRASCEHVSCLNQITVEDVWEKVEKILK